jgi:hypothetical protein
MQTIMPLLGCGLLALSLAFLVSIFFKLMLALGNLLRYEYENHREQWIKDGRPQALSFWKPPVESESPNLFERLFTLKASITTFKLLFITPDWAKEHAESAKYLQQYRKFALLWNLGVPVWFCVIFPSVIFVFTPR